jgi:hypothetical protein
MASMSAADAASTCCALYRAHDGMTGFEWTPEVSCGTNRTVRHNAADVTIALQKAGRGRRKRVAGSSFDTAFDAGGSHKKKILKR